MASLTTTTYQDLCGAYDRFCQAPLKEEEFWPGIASFTEQALMLAKNSLRINASELFAPLSGVAVCCTGSDSRSEKCGLGSPVECIVITPRKEANPFQFEIVRKIVKMCCEEEPLFYPVVEQKGLEGDLVSKCDLNPVFPKDIPTRAFDALFLAGEKDLFESYKRKVFEEISTGSADLKSFRDTFLTVSLRNLRQEVANKPRKAPLLKLDSGTVFYDKNGGRGLKHDVLRAVQYSIAYKIFLLVRGKKLTEADVKSIPSKIMDRLAWLREKKLTPLSDQEIFILGRHYTQASYWYARLNAKVVEEKVDQTTMILDPRELRPVLQETHDLCQKMLS